MNKFLKKTLSFSLAALLTVGMSATVFAEGEGNTGNEGENTTETPSTPAEGTGESDTKSGEVKKSGIEAGTPSKITIKTDENDTHEYIVYQIFKGKFETEGDSIILTEAKYGFNFGTEDADVPKATLDEYTKKSADELAKEIEAHLVNDKNPADILKADHWTSKDLDPGYYLIVDDTTKGLSDGDAYSKFMVSLSGKNVDISVKKQLPAVEKTIVSDTLGDDNTVNVAAAGKKANNVSVGDTVSFKIEGTIPASATDYEHYYYVINDKLDDGFSFDKATANITVKHGEHVLKELTDYWVYTGNDADGQTFQIALLNAKSLAGQTITVTYNAVLAKDCEKGDVPNKNIVTITYSNDPSNSKRYDKNADPDKPYDPENPQNPQDPLDPGKPSQPGKPEVTPKDDSHPVPPTGETPEEVTNTYTATLVINKVDEQGNKLAGASFSVEGNSIQDIYVTKTSYAEDADGTYYLLNDGTYTETAPTDETTSNYADTAKKYKKTTNVDEATVTEHVCEKLFVDENGVLKLEGIGAGEYTIKEIDVPKGYNKAEDLEIKVEFDGNAETSHWEYDGQDVTNGIITVNVVNRKGGVLPETGGIGTRMFYVIGGALAVGAGILLVAKKRMA